MKKQIRKFSEKLNTPQRIIVAIAFPILLAIILFSILAFINGQFYDDVYEIEFYMIFLLVLIPIITYFEFYLFGKMKNKFSNKILILFIVISFLFSCKNNDKTKDETTVKQEKPFDRYKLDDFEREVIINAFTAYTEFDTTDLNSIKNIDKVLKNKNVNRNEIVREVREISLEAIKLAEMDSLKQLMDLMEKERDKFYLHPANTIDNELKFHNASIILYMVFYDQVEFASKSLSLLKISLNHIDALHTLTGKWPKEYVPLLYDFKELSTLSGDNESLIMSAERFCKYFEDIGQVKDNEDYYSTLSLLKGLYEDSNNSKKADICQRKLDKLN